MHIKQCSITEVQLYYVLLFLFSKSGGQGLAIIEHTCNLSTWEVEEGSQFGIILSHKANRHLRKENPHLETGAVCLSGCRGRGSLAEYCALPSRQTCNFVICSISIPSLISFILNQLPSFMMWVLCAKCIITEN